MSDEKVTLHYVGWGGKDATVSGERIRLGSGVLRKRSWLWHFSFGYVSGFPIHGILYYLLTRETFGWVYHRAWMHERADFEARNGQSWPSCRPECTRPHR